MKIHRSTITYLGLGLLAFLSILLLLTIVCPGQRKGASKLNDDEFVELFVKVARDTEKHASDPEELRERHNALFKEYGVSLDEVQEVMEKFREKPERWMKILEKIKEGLEEERDGKNRVERKGG